MSQPYIGEIRLVAFNFAPSGWAFCNGQTMAISDNETLYQLIGTTYGGDGQTTFVLPNLQSRVPIHTGTGGGATYVLSQQGGEEQVTLNVSQLPVHSHVALANSGAGTQASPANGFWAANSALAYSSNTPNSSLAVPAIQTSGGNVAHNNMIPYQAINFIIALFGVYPTPT